MTSAITVTISGPVGSGKSILAHAIASLMHNNSISVQLHDDGGMRTIEPKALNKEFPKSTSVLVEVSKN